MIIKIILITIFNMLYVGCFSFKLPDFFSVATPEKEIKELKIELGNFDKKDNNSSITDQVYKKENEKLKEQIKKIEDTSKSQLDDKINKKESNVDKFKKNHNIEDIINIIDNG